MKFGNLSGARETVSKFIELANTIGEGSLRLDIRRNTDLQITKSLSVRVPKDLVIAFKVVESKVEVQFTPPLLGTYFILSKNVSSVDVELDKISIKLGIITGEIYVED